jgi:hypothetical protein
MWLIIGATALSLFVGVPQAPPAGGYSDCEQAAQDGQANIPQDAPGYRAALDRDDDGIACETDN